MLAHSEVVVGAPDRHFRLAGGRVTGCPRERTAVTFQIGENPIATFLVQTIQFAFEKCLEIHEVLQTSAPDTEGPVLKNLLSSAAFEVNPFCRDFDQGAAKEPYIPGSSAAYPIALHRVAT
jgi:hypothetical protein